MSSALSTSLLHAAALTIPGYAGVNPKNIAAWSLRSSGAMALLLGGVDPDKIRILGRWRSDTMFCYLYGHALPLIQDNLMNHVLRWPLPIRDPSLLIPSQPTLLHPTGLSFDQLSLVSYWWCRRGGAF